jgi:hypothetical protein
MLPQMRGESFRTIASRERSSPQHAASLNDFILAILPFSESAQSKGILPAM